MSMSYNGNVIPTNTSSDNRPVQRRLRAKLADKRRLNALLSDEIVADYALTTLGRAYAAELREVIARVVDAPHIEANRRLPAVDVYSRLGGGSPQGDLCIKLLARAGFILDRQQSLFVLPSSRSIGDAEELLSALEQRLKTLTVNGDASNDPLAAAHNFLTGVATKSGNILQYVVDPSNEEVYIEDDDAREAAYQRQQLQQSSGNISGASSYHDNTKSNDSDNDDSKRSILTANSPLQGIAIDTNDRAISEFDRQVAFKRAREHEAATILGDRPWEKSRAIEFSIACNNLPRDNNDLVVITLNEMKLPDWPLIAQTERASWSSTMEFNSRLCLSADIIRPTADELAAYDSVLRARAAGDHNATIVTATPPRQVVLTIYGLGREQKKLGQENTIAQVYINMSDLWLTRGVVVDRTYPLQSSRHPQLVDMKSSLVLRASWTPPLSPSLAAHTDVALLYRGIILRHRRAPKPASMIGQPLQAAGPESKQQFAFYTPPDDKNPQGALNWSMTFSRNRNPADSIGLHEALIAYNQDEVHITGNGVSFYAEGLQGITPERVHVALSYISAHCADISGTPPASPFVSDQEKRRVAMLQEAINALKGQDTVIAALFDTGFAVQGVFADSGTGPYSRPLLLWLQTNGKSHDIATIAWSEPNQPISSSCRLSLTDLIEVRTGRRTPLLLSTAAAEVTDDQAFSLHTKTGSLSVYVSPAATRDRLLVALERVIKAAAHADKLVAASAHAAQSPSLASPTWSTKPKSHGVPTLAQLQSQINNVATVDSIVAMMMNTGVTVTAVFPVEPFANQPAGGAVVKEVNLWFQTHKNDLGSFHWGPVSSKDTRPGYTIPLSDLCDVRTGRRTDALSLPIASRYGEDVCYSIHSPATELSIICTNKETRAAQLKAIGRLLVAADRGPKSRPLSVPSRAGVHYSVPSNEPLPPAAITAAPTVPVALPPTATSPSPIPGATTTTSVAVVAAVSDKEVKQATTVAVPTPLSPVATGPQPLDTPTVIPLLLRGAEFVSYIEPAGEPSVDPADGKRRWNDDAYRGEDVYIWLEPPVAGDTSSINGSGVLCWVPTKETRNRATSKAQLPLLHLTDVGLSKYPLKVPKDVIFYPTSAPAPLCITLCFGAKGSKVTRLHLQAKLAGTPRAWLEEIKVIKSAQKPLAPLTPAVAADMDALRNGLPLPSAAAGESKETKETKETKDVSDEEKKPMIADGGKEGASDVKAAPTAGDDKKETKKDQEELRVLSAPATIQARADLIHDIRVSISTIANSTLDTFTGDIQPAEYAVTEKLEFAPAGGVYKGVTIPKHSSRAWSCKAYAPSVFRRIRQMSGLSEENYHASISAAEGFSDFISSSKSGSFFFYTHDNAFMLKSESQEEARFLRRILPQYYKYLNDNRESLLSRIFGLYRIKRRPKTFYLIVMQNVFATDRPIHVRYDLKGSTRGRKAKPAELKQIPAVKKDLDFADDKVMIRLPSDGVKTKFKHQLDADSKFLASVGVMDYSLLVGISKNPKQFDDDVARGLIRRQTNYGWRTQQTMIPATEIAKVNSATAAAAAVTAAPVAASAAGDAATAPTTTITAGVAVAPAPFIVPVLPRLRSASSLFQTLDGGILSGESDDKTAAGGQEIYYFGIIDILQEYNLRKKMEHAGLRARTFSNAEISCIPPVPYQKRFYDAIVAHVP